MLRTAGPAAPSPPLCTMLTRLTSLWAPFPAMPALQCSNSAFLLRTGRRDTRCQGWGWTAQSRAFLRPCTPRRGQLGPRLGWEAREWGKGCRLGSWSLPSDPRDPPPHSAPPWPPFRASTRPMASAQLRGGRQHAPGKERVPSQSHGVRVTAFSLQEHSADPRPVSTHAAPHGPKPKVHVRAVGLQSWGAGEGWGRQPAKTLGQRESRGGGHLAPLVWVPTHRCRGGHRQALDLQPLPVPRCPWRKGPGGKLLPAPGQPSTGVLDSLQNSPEECVPDL